MAESYSIVCDTSDEAAWLAARNTGIGASEIAILLGESSWGSNVELYFAKRGELPERLTEVTEQMELGRRFERVGIEITAERAGVSLASGPSLLLRSSSHPWAMATPDALTTDGEPVEVKNMDWGFDDAAWAIGIPEKYQLQCQQQMLVTGAARCLFGVIVRGSRVVWEWVPRDEARIARIVAAGSEFWGYVERGECPPSDGHPHARKALAQQISEEEPVELFEADIEQELAVFERCELAHEKANAAAKKAKRELDAAKDELAKALDGHRSGFTATGWRIAWKTTEKRGYVVQPSTTEHLTIKAPE